MTDDRMSIQWYPGHMTKTRRQMEADLKLVDAVCELVDARIPYSSRNPDIAALCGAKPRMVILNRIDLADPAMTALWSDWFRAQGAAVVCTDCKSRRGIDRFVPAVRALLAEKLQRYAEKGQVGRPLKLMIVGIPNVGKSSLINKLAGNKKAKVENRPGVTRDKQWVTTKLGLDLLDTPGVLWPKFDDKLVGENLAITGAIKDDILDSDTIAMIFCSRMMELYPGMFCERFKLGDPAQYEDYTSDMIFELVGRKRGLLVSGGEISYERTAMMLLDEFRNGKIGRISLEKPQEFFSKSRG